MQYAALVATGIALSRLSMETITVVPAVDSASRVGLTAGVIGWMPAPIDIAVWSSLWALARARDSGCTPESRGVLRDFDIGYITTLILAICFVVLGAAIMYGPGQEFSPSAAGFASQVVDLYTKNLGDWSWPLIATAAFLAMLSTTVTCADGFPRTVAALVSEAWPQRNEGPQGSQSTYWIVFGVGAIGAILILSFTLVGKGMNFKHLVDFVTITSFIAAPLLAFFNHRAAHASEVPAELRPSRLFTIWSICGIVLMGAFALGYIAFRLWQAVGS